MKRSFFFVAAFLFSGGLVFSALGGESFRLSGVTVSVEIEVDQYKPDRRKWDTTGAPDPSGKITFADGSVIEIPKHQDSYKASAIGSNIALKAGDEINVYLEDRDIAQHDLIASGFVKYTGESEFSARVGSAKFSFRIR